MIVNCSDLHISASLCSVESYSFSVADNREDLEKITDTGKSLKLTLNPFADEFALHQPPPSDQLLRWLGLRLGLSRMLDGLTQSGDHGGLLCRVWQPLAVLPDPPIFLLKIGFSCNLKHKEGVIQLSNAKT
jgi:hypothetical protein